MENKDFDTKDLDTEKRQTTMVDFDYDKYAEVEKKATHTDGAAALTLGILSLVTNLFAGFISVILGIIGMVFGIRGRRDPQNSGMATAGLICSVIGVVLGVLSVIASIFFFGLMATDMLDIL